MVRSWLMVVIEDSLLQLVPGLVGVIQRGEFIGGVGHPEMGHYYVAQKHPMDIEKRI